MDAHGPGHRVLEAFVRRIAAGPEAEAFALRGGMLVRHWFPTLGRVARDVDLVCAWPLDREAARRALTPMLARDLRDGVRFGDRFRLDPIQTHTPHPGLRLVARARVDEQFDELHADLTFRLPVWPEAVVAPMHGCALPQCRPETIVARKLAVTTERGPAAWRPKDLADLWSILRHRAPGPRLGEAVERTVELAAVADGPARATFWQDPIAIGRWARFRRAHRHLAVPGDLAAVAGEVRAAIVALVPQERA